MRSHIQDEAVSNYPCLQTGNTETTSSKKTEKSKCDRNNLEEILKLQKNKNITSHLGDMMNILKSELLDKVEMHDTQANSNVHGLCDKEKFAETPEICFDCNPKIHIFGIKGYPVIHIEQYSSKSKN